jgi:hypothetical protein
MKTSSGKLTKDKKSKKSNLKLSPDLIPWDYYSHISKTQENLQERKSYIKLGGDRCFRL